MNDIYKAPESSISEQEHVLAGAPDYKLFKLPSVGIATFFGTTLAGGIIMAINSRRLGDSAGGKQILTIALLLTVAVIASAFALPDEFPGIIFTIAQVVGMNQWAKIRQEAVVNQHLDAGGEMESNWLAFGISLLALVPIIAAVFLVVFLTYPAL